MSHIRLHIVFIGFMGSGKSTIGKLLATRLNLPFYDLDYEIESKEKMSISKIFELKGETYFRKIENKMLLEILESKDASVVATGGGAPCFHKGMDIITKYSMSIYLKVGRDRLCERIFSDKSRPLIAGKTKKELKQFIDKSLRKREKTYFEANLTIMAYDQPQSIVRRIVKQLDRSIL